MRLDWGRVRWKTEVGAEMKKMKVEAREERKRARTTPTEQPMERRWVQKKQSRPRLERPHP